MLLHLAWSTGTRNYRANSNNMKLVHWPLMDGLLHLVERAQRGGTRGRICNSQPINGQCTNHRIAV